MKYIQTNLFRAQIISQIVIIGLVIIFNFSEFYQAVFCGILLSLLGIPHGANDHLYRTDKSIIGLFKFIGIYLLSIIIYFLLWWFFPPLAFAVFFIISFHHFGQSNFENDSVWYFPSIFWGIWILLFPVLLHWNQALEIFNQMLNLKIQLSNTDVDLLNNWQILLISTFALFYLFSLFIYEKKFFISYLIQFILVSIWYYFTPLLFGFIVVFCLWHSLQSYNHQLDYFIKTKNESRIKFMISLLPFGLLAISVFGLYVYFYGFEIDKAFILLSLITLPHVLVMHTLYAETHT